MHECPKCNQSFRDNGFCPHDGTTLIETDAPNTGHHSDDLLTHAEHHTGTLTGSAVENVLKGVLETRKAERLIGIELDGRYKIEKQIGEGGMGVVFLAHHMVIEKAVAIKVLRAEVASDASVVKRFVQEARAASRIGHPNIIDVTDFGTTQDGLTYQVMEYLEGQTLSGLLHDEGTLTLPRALGIVAQMARALDAAHDKGIVHRDLKPENVFLMQRDGRSDFVKIVDFGIAKVQPSEGDPDSPRLTRVGTVFGTPEYMSPEQASGRTDVDLRTDIYALGIILYQMLCGRVPLRGETTVRTLAMQMLDTPVPMHQAYPDIDITDSQEAVIMRALAKKREKRHQTMAEFLNALEEVTNHTELDLPLLMKQERLSAEHVSQNAFDTVPEADLIAASDSPRPPQRKTSASEVSALAEDHEHGRKRRAGRATDPVFLRDNKNSAVPQYEAVDGEETGPIQAGNNSRFGLVLLALLVSASVAALLLYAGSGESEVAKVIMDASPRPIDATPSPAVIFDAAVVNEDAGPVLPDAQPSKNKDRRDLRRPDTKGPTGPRITGHGILTVSVHTKPPGASLFLGQTYAGSDGTNMSRKFGESVVVSCHLKNYLDGSVKVVFDGKREIYLCKLRRGRVKKCVEGTKNPFDKCP